MKYGIRLFLLFISLFVSSFLSNGNALYSFGLAALAMLAILGLCRFAMSRRIKA